MKLPHEADLTEQVMTNAPDIRLVPPSYNQVVEEHSLIILMTKKGLAEKNGSVLAKHSDTEIADSAYNALFRLVEIWRLNAPHLGFLFDLASSMRARRRALHAKMNEAGEDHRSQSRHVTHTASDLEVITSIHGILDEQGAAEYGIVTYAGCVVFLLNSWLIQFRRVLDVRDDDWDKAPPFFNGYSFGQVVEAAAASFQHDDEWSKTQFVTPQQSASQKVLTKALSGTAFTHVSALGRCPDVLSMLSSGQDFDQLAANLFAFAHNVALRRRAATMP